MNYSCDTYVCVHWRSMVNSRSLFELRLNDVTLEMKHHIGFGTRFRYYACMHACPCINRLLANNGILIGTIHMYTCRICTTWSCKLQYRTLDICTYLFWFELLFGLLPCLLYVQKPRQIYEKVLHRCIRSWTSAICRKHAHAYIAARCSSWFSKNDAFMHWCFGINESKLEKEKKKKKKNGGISNHALSS